jgi:hypothetical protein
MNEINLWLNLKFKNVSLDFPFHGLLTIIMPMKERDLTMKRECSLATTEEITVLASSS